MRSDMAKVIVERPRYGSRMRGHSKGYWKKLQRVPADELPKRERIKPTSGDTKSLNEHLGPLQRFLQKQVGRPWDKVFAEICAHISRDSAVQDHVRDHVGDFVALKVIEIGGVLHEVTRWGGLFPLEKGWRFQFSYVCPKTGLLKRLKRIRRPRRQADQQPTVQVSLDFETSFIRRSGLWHRVRFQAFPKKTHNEFPNIAFTIFDVFQQKQITRKEAVAAYGRGVFVKETRPATRAEIRKYCEPQKTPNRV